MIESAFTKALHKKFPRHIKVWKINDNFEGGVPDALYRDKRGVLPLMWSEHKLIKTLPKRDSTLIKPNLSELQKQWLREALEAGEKACVIIGCESLRDHKGVKSIVLFGPETWEYGITAAEFAEMAESYDEVAERLFPV